MSVSPSSAALPPLSSYFTAVYNSLSCQCSIGDNSIIQCLWVNACLHNDLVSLHCCVPSTTLALVYIFFSVTKASSDSTPQLNELESHLCSQISGAAEAQIFGEMFTGATET